ncbi:MAG: hypothetical protein M1812_000815 [Candelaria pacifica]|nr:MAG: hypothetical protein M1812_000815 [Candelaria pacifica]
MLYDFSLIGEEMPPYPWTKQHDLFIYDAIKKQDPTKEDKVQIIKQEILVAFPDMFNETNPIDDEGLEMYIDWVNSASGPPREIFFDGKAAQDVRIAWEAERKRLGEERVAKAQGSREQK